MPTGYTAAIAEGITFRQYAMSCARAFGALIDMRDEPSNAEIPEEFKASTYHAEAIASARKELASLDGITAEEAAEKAKASHAATIARHTEAIEDANALRAKYEAMLADVDKYDSPSPDHDNLKKFMAEQIRESIRFDCGSDYHEQAIADAVELTGAQWIEAEKKRLQDSIEYNTKGQMEDDERTANRNEWVRKLRESLAQ